MIVVRIGTTSESEAYAVPQGYSPDVAELARSIPGCVWDRSSCSWQGYPDAIAAFAKAVEEAKIATCLGTVCDTPMLDMALPKEVGGLAIRDYQTDGVKFIVTNAPAGGALLADDPGLGKSVQGLLTAQSLIRDYMYTPHAIVVCPAVSKEVWRAEAEKWCPGYFHVQVLSGTKSGGDFRGCGLRDQPTLTILNFDIAHAWIERLSHEPYGILIIDEGHYLQNERARRSVAVKLLAQSAEARVALTGTPMTTRPRDLWNLLDTLAPERFGKGPWKFLFRHCTHPSTPLWMGDYSFKPIGEAKVGDEVMGWEDGPSQSTGMRSHLMRAKVTAVSRRKAAVVRIMLASGQTVICTPDHLWKGYHLTEAHGYRFLTPQVGSVLTRLTDVHAAWPVTGEYILGYVCGALEGDGIVRQYAQKPRGTWAASVSTHVSLEVESKEFAARFNSYVCELGFETSCHVTKSKYQLVRVLGGTSTFEFFSTVKLTTNDQWRGWLAGMYDAEGHAQVISQSVEVHPETHARIDAALVRFGFATSNKTFGIRILGGREEMIRFWNLMRPTLRYKLDAALGDAVLLKSPEKIISIETAGISEVVALTTTSGNYVAAGLASKNCDARRETIAKNTTVWVTDGSSNEEELAFRLQWMMLRRTKAQVMTELPARVRQVVPIKVPERAIVPVWKEGWGKSRRDTLKRALALSGTGKIKEAVELASSRVAEGHSVVLFSHLRETAAKVAKAMKVGAVFLATGEVTAKERSKLITDATKTAKTQPVVIAATIDALGVSVDLSFADVVIFIDLDWVPSKLIQAESRCVFEGQLVHTRRGFIPIEQVAVGDDVITHTGAWRKVTAVHRRGHHGLTTTIDYTRYGLPLEVTHDHKLYVKKRAAAKPAWLPAHEVLPGDMLVMPRTRGGKTLYWIDLPVEARHDPAQQTNTPLSPEDISRIRMLVRTGVRQHDIVRQYELSTATVSRIINKKTHNSPTQRNGRYVSLPRKIRLNKTLLYIFGWYLAEGWTVEGTSSRRGGHQTCFCGHRKERPILKRIAKFFKRWGLSSTLSDKKNALASELHVYSVELTRWFTSWFGTGSYTKRIPAILFDLPASQVRHLVRGYIDGDGYRRDRGTSAKSVEWVSVSQTLAAQIALLSARCGESVSLRCIDNGKNVGQWIGSYYKGRLTDKNYVYNPVRAVTTSQTKRMPSRQVYDLTVAGDHSFVVGQAAVHNCHRHGVKNTVLIYYLVGIGTADEYVKKKVIERLDLYEKIIGGAEESKGLKYDLGDEMDRMSEDEVLADLRRAVMAGEIVYEDEEEAT